MSIFCTHVEEVINRLHGGPRLMAKGQQEGASPDKKAATAGQHSKMKPWRVFRRCSRSSHARHLAQSVFPGQALESILARQVVWVFGSTDKK